MSGDTSPPSSSGPSSQQPRRQSVYKKIGQYALVKEIGQGSFARVYKGRSEGSSAEDFAIKMVSKVHLRAENQEMIEKEIEILHQLNHPNIIKLRDFKKTSNNWYLIFEFCELGDLEQYIKAQFGGRLPVDIAVFFMHQLASGYKEIRRLNIVHRDLKLANILLNKDLVVKLGDFGFAKHFEQDSLLQSYCGTPITMAPEILKREKYNEKCDIWSLGVILYQMIYGRPPFNPHKGAHLQDLINLIDEGNLTFEGAQIPQDLQAFIVSMLQPNPAKRISFEEFFASPCLEQEYLTRLNDKFKPSSNDSTTATTTEMSSDTITAAAAVVAAAAAIASSVHIVIPVDTPARSVADELSAVELKEKQDYVLEFIQKVLHERINAEKAAYMLFVDDLREVALQLSSDASIEHAQYCAWSALLLLVSKTVKTIENLLEISFDGQLFRVPFPKTTQEQLKQLSKELFDEVKAIRLESNEQAKNTDAYNMLFGSVLSYADYLLLNEFINPSPHTQLRYYNQCLKLTELLLSYHTPVFSRTVFTVKDNSIQITKQDIQQIIQIQMEDHQDTNIFQAKSSRISQPKKAALIKSVISVDSQPVAGNIQEMVNLADKTEELKALQTVYQSRYNAYLAQIQDV